MHHKNILLMSATTRLHDRMRELSHAIDVSIALANEETFSQAVSSGHEFDLVILDGEGMSQDSLNAVDSFVADNGFIPMLLVQDPDKLASFLRSLGAVSDAFLLGWRRTSLHLLIPDPQWINFLVKNARKCNQDLPVIGEAYLGQTAESNESERAVTYNIPENISAVLIFGIGYKGVAIERAIELGGAGGGQVLRPKVLHQLTAATKGGAAVDRVI